MSSDASHIERLHTVPIMHSNLVVLILTIFQDELEIGATEAVQKHFQRHVISPKTVSQRKLDFEHKRPRWLRECLAEATGVFFYGMNGTYSSTDSMISC